MPNKDKEVTKQLDKLFKKLEAVKEESRTSDIKTIITINKNTSNNNDNTTYSDSTIRESPPDRVNTLIFTIVKHLIGTLNNITKIIHDQLSNLTCSTISHFRQYKDLFTSRVMIIDESNKPFWKENFVNRLPSLFPIKFENN